MSLPGEISLAPERATTQKRRSEKSAEVVVAKSKPGRRYADTGRLWRREGLNEKDRDSIRVLKCGDGIAVVIRATAHFAEIG